MSMDKKSFDCFERDIFGKKTDYDIFLCYPFSNYWFNTIIYFRSNFTVFFILLIVMFFSQVLRTTISFTWRIIVFTLIIISITNVVFLFLKMLEVLYYYVFLSFKLLHRLSVSRIVSFPLIKVSEVLLILVLWGAHFFLAIQLLHFF